MYFALLFLVISTSHRFEAVGALLVSTPFYSLLPTFALVVSGLSVFDISFGFTGDAQWQTCAGTLQTCAGKP